MRRAKQKSKRLSIWSVDEDRTNNHWAYKIVTGSKVSAKEIDLVVLR